MTNSGRKVRGLLLAVMTIIAALSLGTNANADNPTTLYILGQVNQHTSSTWDPTKGVAMTYHSDNGTFTADVYCQNATNDFSFATELNSWAVLNSDNGSRRYCSNSNDYWAISSNVEGESRFDSQIELYHGEKGSFRVPAGAYTITVDIPNMNVTVHKKSLTITTLPLNETVTSGATITARSNLTQIVADTGSGENVTIQLKSGSGTWGNSVTLTDHGLATIHAKASIGSLDVETTMAYNVRALTALDAIQYNWTDDEGNEHTSSLTDVANDPNQILALLNAVYVNPDVPGAKYHYEYQPDGTPWPTGTQKSEKTVNYESHSRVGYDWWQSSQRQANLKQRVSWIDCDGEVPSPNEEGATVLFVQIKDSWKAEDILPYYSGGAMTRQPYAVQDKQIVSDAFESVQLITNKMEVNDANNPGNLFLIDKITTSRFYFISKGRVRAGTGRAPLYLAYEQLSPVQVDPAGDMGDVLYSGGIYNFVHDCYDVFRGDKSPAYNNQYIPHYAQLSGFDVDDLNNLEARALQNLTLFLPDKRFKRPDSGSGDGFLYNYNSEEDVTTAPKMLLYKAELDATASPSSTTDWYDITLDWSSWFDAQKIKADVNEQFYVYVIDEDGNQTLLNEAIAADSNQACDTELDNPTTLNTYTYRVKQLQERQTFTFIVIANPQGSEMFVKTNVAKVVIPGHDKFFLDGAEYRSRYSLTDEKNIYKNTLRLRPNNDYNNIDCTANHYEMYRTPKDGTPTLIATISFMRNGSSYDYNINYVAATQDTQLKYDETTPATSGTISQTSYLDIIDRFTASTETNSHPESYTYFLGFDGGNGTSSNSYVVPVFKTTNQVSLAGFTLSQINNDTNHGLVEEKEVQFSLQTQMDHEQSIDRYDIHRVHSADYHTHIGRLRHIGGNTMSVIGISHTTGNMSNDFGTIDTKESQIVTVYDDLEYCPTNNPEYVTEIYTTAFGFDGKPASDVQNHYGSHIVQTQVPELEVTVLGKSRTDVMTDANKVDYMGYSANLQFTPEPAHEATKVYFYRSWRVNDDGSETLLNEESDNSDYSSDYSYLRAQWPGESAVSLNDVYSGLAIPEKKTETVTVIDYDDLENYTTGPNGESIPPSHEEVVVTGGEKDVEYIVRMYSTRQNPNSINPSQRRTKNEPSDEGGFYVTEKRVTVNYTDDTITGIDEIGNSTAPIVAVKYYNLQGIASNVPFDGFNIKVITRGDGTTTSTKFIK